MGVARIGVRVCGETTDWPGDFGRPLLRQDGVEFGQGGAQFGGIG